MKAKFLIIEDETKIGRFLSLELMHEGYEVKVIEDGREGLDEALATDYDGIILDLMLPSLNGMEVLRRLRQKKQTPVLILTARDQVMDKVTGLDLGADDYLTKPFAIEELLARLRKMLKHQVEDDFERHIGKLSIALNRHTVSYDGNAIDLTRKEYDLLIYLVENKNNVVTREQILDVVWDYDFYGDTNVVDVYIRYLRSKIDDRFHIKLIETLRGTGYIIKG